MVKKGDLLLVIDPRPDAAAVAQGAGQLARDQAMLANARIDLGRYQDAFKTHAVPEQQAATKWFAWPSRFWSFGPTVSETLLDFGMRRGENEEAWAAYDQAVATYRQTVLTAFQAVEDNLALLRILGTEVQLRQTAAKSSAHYLDLSQTRFKAGIDSFLNVSAAQTADLTNQNGLVQTQLRLVMASVTLVTAAGGGWEDSDLPSPGHLLLVPAK
jgi:outer membrane protein TolC